MEREPQLTDVGTRYEHLKDYAEAMEACADILEGRGLKTRSDVERFLKFKVAAEMAQHTVDNFIGLRDAATTISLRNLLESVPDSSEGLEGGRGTPLAVEYHPERKV